MAMTTSSSINVNPFLDESWLPLPVRWNFIFVLAEHLFDPGINFALEHHTGQPETKSLMVPMGDTEKSREVSVTHFHMKKVTTRVYLKRGAVALIGAFDVTGPRDKGDSGPTIENPKRLAFLCADVQEFDAESK